VPFTETPEHPQSQTVRVSKLKEVTDPQVLFIWRRLIAHDVATVGPDEFLARTLMVFVTFIPFLAVFEACRVLRDGDLYTLLLGESPAAR
jgi:hypothetical protein